MSLDRAIWRCLPFRSRLSRILSRYLKHCSASGLAASTVDGEGCARGKLVRKDEGGIVKLSAGDFERFSHAVAQQLSEQKLDMVVTAFMS